MIDVLQEIPRKGGLISSCQSDLIEFYHRGLPSIKVEYPFLPVKVRYCKYSRWGMNRCTMKKGDPSGKEANSDRGLEVGGCCGDPSIFPIGNRDRMLKSVSIKVVGCMERTAKAVNSFHIQEI